jgi:hypothetical protein
MATMTTPAQNLLSSSSSNNNRATTVTKAKTYTIDQEESVNTCGDTISAL